METAKEYYYTYYSYEEYGRGYIGSRKCYCLPEKDVKYFGSYKDKTFKPTQKIILKDDYATREEAYADEIILQRYYKVVENPHFANRAYQTSTKFCLSKEERIKIGKKGNKEGKRLSGIKMGNLCYKNKIGIHALTSEQKSHAGKKGGKICGQKCKELKLGICGLSKEQRSETAKKVNSQKWMCLETGYITNAGALSKYQKARNIDTSKRVRIT